MEKNIILYIIIGLLSIGTVFSHTEEGFGEAEQLIESKIECSELTDDQLKHIGDYYMEQMHPGEAHEAMDEMMGGEGSESVREMHINMAKAFYCGEHDAMSSGMMNMMIGKGMGMMGSSGVKSKGGMMNMVGGNMMSNFSPFSWFGMGFGFVFMILFWVIIIWIIVWLVIKYMKHQKKEKSESPMEILKKRYAMGEINEEEFEKMKKEISK